HSLVAAGYDDTFEVVRARPQTVTVVRSAPPGHRAIDVPLDDVWRGPAVPAPGCEGIILDAGRGTIELPVGVGLDLGGVGKGAAAWWSESLAKAALMAGVDAGVELLRGYDVRGWVVDDDGLVRSTEFAGSGARR